MIQLSDNYRLKPDNMEFILQEKRTKKPKDGTPPVEHWADIGYYNRLKNALKEYSHREQLKAKSIEDLMQILKNLNLQIKKLIGLSS